jgi:tmRNA-binding protein
MKEKTERELAQANIAENRKAYHDYFLVETFEAGIALLGTEVKAIREGRVNLRDSYARLENGELFLLNVNISPAMSTTSRCGRESCCCTATSSSNWWGRPSRRA